MTDDQTTRYNRKWRVRRQTVMMCPMGTTTGEWSALNEPSAWEGRCLRCGRAAELDDRITGCHRCAAAGFGVPIVPTRAGGPAPRKPGVVSAGLGAMWRWASLLVPVGEPVSLGEGGTPLTELTGIGLPGRVLLKDERANPTGSFKDRLASAAVSWSRHRGATTVAVASSGNAGISAAAYAGAAGLRCVVLSTPGLPDPTRAALTALGARLLLTDTGAQRQAALRTGVQRLGWFPLTNYLDPPVSSHPVGVHAYRTIAYEIAEAMDWQVPDWVAVPVSRGDGLFGVWAGFAELAELGWTRAVPRMLAVERFPSLTAALAQQLEQPLPVAGDSPAQARSISNRQGTVMALQTLRRSAGTAISCDDEQMWSAWRRLATRGILLELASAAALHGATELASRGELKDSATVVLLGTAAPYSQGTLGPIDEGVRLADPTDPTTLETLTAQT